MSELISWDVAAKVAKSVAGYFPQPPSAETVRLEMDLEDLFVVAQHQVSQATGLDVPGIAHPVVMDRSEWVDANLASFRVTLTPLLDQLSKKLPGWRLSGFSAGAAGVQLGAILGWMSSKVLGQFDVLLADAGADIDAGKVYFVAPNIISIEHKYGFNEKQFRHWIALHELTHRAQFTGVPWMNGYFRDLVQESLSFANPDPSAFLTSLRRIYEEVREGRNPLGDNGPIGLFATPEQLESLRKITGLMSLLEGHGDVVMNRAGAEDILESGRFAQVLSQRRNSQKGISKLISQLLGIDAKMRQYQEGEIFVHAVERAGGARLFNRVWERADNLPDADEIRHPSKWIERMSVHDGAAD